MRTEANPYKKVHDMFYLLVVLALAILGGASVWCNQRKNTMALEALKVSQRKNWQEENERRVLARKDWLATNKAKIYFHTIDGITAALTEADYEKARVVTRDALTDGRWDRNYMMFSTRTYVLVTVRGKEVISSHAQGKYAEAKISGFRSALDRLKREYNVELIDAKDIFVPWTREETSIDIMLARKGNDLTLYTELVESQIPTELHPLPRGDF